MNRRSSLVAGLALVALVFAACAPAPAPSPTAAPAKPAEKAAEKPAAKPAASPAAKPAVTAAPAKPAASPAAKPAASPAAKAAAKAAASPAAKTAAKPAGNPEAISIPKPSGDLTIRHAYSSVPGFADVPLLMTSDRLKSEGWKIDDISFAQSELAVESTAKGDTGLGNGASVAALRAIEKGAPLKLVAERTANEWTIASITSIRSCADLGGKRVAIHSEGAVSTAMVKNWIERTCQGTNPNYIVIPGSENRAAALLNGQIDASPLELADWINVNQKSPGKFHLLENFARGLPDLSTTPIYVNVPWAERNRQLVVTYLAELLKTHRIIQANPQRIQEAAAQKIEALDKQVIPEITRAYQEINAFDEAGGLTLSKVNGTIKFFTDAGQIEPGMTAEKAADLSYIQEAQRLVNR